jgi:hypothetical protein
MAVDEARQDQRAFCVNSLTSAVTLPGLRDEVSVCSDKNYGVSANTYGAPLNDSPGGIHGDNGGIDDEQVEAYRLFLRNLLSRRVGSHGPGAEQGQNNNEKAFLWSGRHIIGLA